jgi:hypothetical protein
MFTCRHPRVSPIAVPANRPRHGAAGRNVHQAVAGFDVANGVVGEPGLEPGTGGI